MKELEDRPLSSQEEQLAASLPVETVALIDQELLANVQTQFRKVAMVIALAMENPQLEEIGLPDVYFARRIRRLVEDGKLISVGDTKRMRACEVRIG